jgi:16S rRNA (adenine(1408)-N(1))-methyltransferase
VVIDIGTGSGSAVLRRAAREPRTLFLALDADAAALADASRRAARPARRGGLANVVFVAAAAEALPGILAACADEATVVLPWGSLLSAVLDPAGDSFARVVACVRRGGLLRVLVSSAERDARRTGAVLDDVHAADLARAYECAGLTVVTARHATRADVDELSSGWGRRLGIPERRGAWLFELRTP